VSLINKVLQDIDRRQAATEGDSPLALGRAAVDEPAPRRGGFWALAGVLVVVIVGAGAWAAWQMRPGKVVGEAAFQQAAEAQKRALPSVSPPMVPPPAPVVQAPVAAPPAVPEAPATEAPPSKPAAATPHKRPKALPRREVRNTSASDAAETKYREAIALLNEGRVSEAQDRLAGALIADPSHVAARQAQAALLLEQERVDAARQILLDGLALDPTQSTFALALARIYTRERDFPAALEVMDRAGAAASRADFQALRGDVLRRMGRHAQAVDAFENAVRGGAQPGATWVGLGLSLEALGRRSEAAEAYRRALAAEPLTQKLRYYTEARLRLLQ
jgi:MSHA biogenesis protein MshN